MVQASKYRPQAQLVRDVAYAAVQSRHVAQPEHEAEFNKEMDAAEKELTAAMAKNNVRFVESGGGK